MKMSVSNVRVALGDLSVSTIFALTVLETVLIMDALVGVVLGITKLVESA